MRVLVTGCTGFVGSALAAKLLESGTRVRCLVRATSNLHWLAGLDLERVIGELSQPESLIEAVRDVDVVYHLAGVTKAATPDGYRQGNVVTTRNLLAACDSTAGRISRFVFVSSQAAGGPSLMDSEATEDQQDRPISFYGRAKLEAEGAVRQYGSRFPVTIVRPCSVYGPRDRDILRLFRIVKRGISPVLGRGRQRVSLVHVDDLVEAILLAGRIPGAEGRLYYVSDGAAHDWVGVGKTVAAALGVRAITLHIPVSLLDLFSIVVRGAAKLRGKPALLNADKVREMKALSWVCSNRRAREELGFQPAIPLEQGTRATALWYREMGWL